MELTDAITGMLKTREALRTRQGVSDPYFISEQMQRLTQYVSAVEEHLAEREEQLEIEEMNKFIHYTRTEGKSVNQAAIITKQEVGSSKGEIAKLKRYVSSSWQIVGVSQSRFNHLQKQVVGQI